jgi:hypothetical protein
MDTKTTLTWEQNISANMFTWEEAQSHCAGLDLDGAGWELPSMKELQTLVARTQFMPAIDKTVFPDTPSTYFWTSSEVKASPTDAWSVDFTSGYTGNSARTTPHRVRCVR